MKSKLVLLLACWLTFSSALALDNENVNELFARKSFAKFVIEQLKIDFSELDSPEKFGADFAAEIKDRLEKSPWPIYIDGVVGHEVQPVFGVPSGADNQRIHMVRLHKDKKLSSLEHWLSIFVQLDQISQYDSYNSLYMRFVLGEIAAAEFQSQWERLDWECLVKTATSITNNRDLQTISNGTSPMLDSMRDLASGKLREEYSEALKLFQRREFPRRLIVHNADTSLSIADRLELYKPQKPIPDHSPLFGEKMLQQFLESRPDLQIDTPERMVVYDKISWLLNAQQNRPRILLLSQPNPKHRFTRPPRFAEGTGFDGFVSQDVVNVREDRDLTVFVKWLVIGMEILRARQCEERWNLSWRLLQKETSPEQYVEALHELDCNAFKDAHDILIETNSRNGAFYSGNPLCLAASRMQSGNNKDSPEKLPPKLDRREEYFESIGVVR